MAKEFTQAWLDELHDHVSDRVRKVGSQREFCFGHQLKQTYVSLFMNKKFDKISLRVINEIAEKTGFSDNRYSAAERTKQRYQQPERAVEIDNDKEREQMPDKMPKGKPEKTYEKSPDLKAIDNFLIARQEADRLSPNLRKNFINVLRHQLIMQLTDIPSEKIC